MFQKTKREGARRDFENGLPEEADDGVRFQRFGCFRNLFGLDRVPPSDSQSSQEADIKRFRSWLNVLFSQLYALGCDLYSEKGVKREFRSVPEFLRLLLLALYLANHVFFLRELWGTGHVTAVYVSFQGESVLATCKYLTILRCRRRIREMTEMCVHIRAHRPIHRGRATSLLYPHYTRQCGRLVMALFCVYHSAESMIQVAPAFYTATYPIPNALPAPIVSEAGVAIALNYVYQAFFVIATTAINCCVDAMFISMASEASLRLDVLAAGFVNDANEVGGVEEEVEQGEYSKRRKSRFRRNAVAIDLRELNAEHQVCLRFISLLQSTFNGVTAAQFIMSLLIISTSMYSLSTVSDLASAQHIFPFFAGCTTQIFMYTWFAQIMTNKVNDLTNSMYHCDWYHMNPGDRKNLLIMMCSTQKKYVYLAGGLIPVSLGTFVQTLRTAYSYYAVMRQKA